MEFVQNNLRKFGRLVFGRFGFLTVLVTGGILALGASARVSQGCAGTVGIPLEAGDIRGDVTITLPAACHNGRFQLTSESLDVTRPVIVNGRLHQNGLVIMVNLLAPLEGPLTVNVNYEVEPQ